MSQWYVLEWNGLDYDIQLYEWDTATTDEAEVWEEVAGELHSYSSFLVMGKKRLRNLFKAVADFQKQMKGGDMKHAKLVHR